MSVEVTAHDTEALDESRLRELIDVGRNLVAELDSDVIFDRLLEAACEMTGARSAALGVLDSDRDDLERFIPQGIDEAPGQEIDFLKVPIVIRGRAWGNLYLTEKVGGGDFDEADEQSATILAEWAAIAVDNARLYSNVGEQRDSLERAVHSLEATSEICRAVGGETDLDRILETIVKQGRGLVEAGSLLILLEDRGELRVAAAAGEFDCDAELRIPVEGSAPGRVLRSHRPNRLPSIDPDLLSRPGSPGAGVAALLAPMIFHGHSLGVLVALDPPGRNKGFTDENEQVLYTFGASAANAVATAQSVAEDRMRNSIETAERERGRWARELHDEALQSMAGLRVLLSAARRGGDTDRLLSNAIERVDHTIAEMRRLIADLRPATLDELGLGAALEALVERLTWGEVLNVDLRIDLGFNTGRRQARLLGQIEDTVYRLAQEGLNNAARHAGTNRAVVEVIEAGESIRVRIEDSGCGFDPGGETGGFGLLGMRERVALAGGTLEVVSAPGEGTSIVAVLPARYRRESPGAATTPGSDGAGNRSVEGR